MTKVFISYRRTDSHKDAGRIYDRCVNEFGKNNVFKDVDSIPLGSDFRGKLVEAVSQCDVLLAIIGQKWLNARNEKGDRRLDDPSDFVRIEIETALWRDTCLVIPVLVDNASIPEDKDVPEGLRDLIYKNGISIHDDPDFHRDVDRLIHGINSRFKLEQSSKELIDDELNTAITIGTNESLRPGTHLVAVEPPAVERPVNLSFDGAVTNGVPMGWFNSLGHVDYVSTSYKIKVVPRTDAKPGACVWFSNVEAREDEFGSLMQRCPAYYLAGKTIRFVGELQAQDVLGWAGLWLRADGFQVPTVLFDNMHRNPVKGTQPWKEYSLDAVLPIDTAWLNFGIVLSGRGTIWADNLRLLVWENNSWRVL